MAIGVRREKQFGAPAGKISPPAPKFIQPPKRFFSRFRPEINCCDFTTGFGLRPPPAAIIVMTPTGSGKEELRERLPIFYFAPSGRKNICCSFYPGRLPWANLQDYVALSGRKKNAWRPGTPYWSVVADTPVMKEENYHITINEG